MHLARILATGGETPSLRGLLDNEEKYLGDEELTKDLPWGLVDDDDDDDSGNKDAGEGTLAKKAFVKYQTATSMLWGALREQEKQNFHSLAEKWRTERPPPEERQKCVPTSRENAYIFLTMVSPRLAEKYAA
jgi:hypothetical protein